MSDAYENYTPRMKQRYEDEVRQKMADKFNYKS
ncbi:MAG: 50S ribosomal protein L5, partial [Proteobacteria bacterium]|nr:50S ribosomal protein L5 [Pseudomonadota bacterium]